MRTAPATGAPTGIGRAIAERLSNDGLPTIFGWRATDFDDFTMRNAAIFRTEGPAPSL